MAKREIERTVQPSLLDRLTDDEPRSSADPATSYAESLRAFKMGVQRDLEWLLNTRRMPTPLDEEFVELKQSLYTYGLPDVTSLSGDSSAARVKLLREVEEALTNFEPRLMNVRISMVEADADKTRRELHFVVEATLRLDPTPEQVGFDTVLQFSSGQYAIEGKSDA
jgi:type VI secretion system protein ImpF